MVKFAHLLVLSVLIIWIAGSGCVGNDSSDVEDGGVTQNVAEAENADDPGLTPAEIQEIDTDMAELESLLSNASLQEEIELEEL
ncbi:hypothetical protein MSSAC_3092 [Methanosarcina siciliae C2J]|uniref:Uncharacterized protein n=3 Tax=Methanosarcina siciliae TaxID=38027 RepID=A0A0E3PGD6_9EURY|nr:hypothetical protein [Methanosarcina siciliae]AKB29492.1 hypothetical protein MSSIT_2773 [Methanosarcina siciliae T4/M]AKB33429.1 hypothetical protein MSSIH_2739 [Methanosarcina siciliae HI350]AKB37682.1 hypothetical protein MSSAC_3092 [Methanosarcina siciliae C2J]